MLYLIKNSVPAGSGCIAFVPSFGVLKDFERVWTPSDDSKGILDDPNGCGRSLSRIEVIFEKQGGSPAVYEHMQQRYKSAVDSGKRALLIAVYRGKLSEGISFNDGYCRIVFCIGIPFPPYTKIKGLCFSEIGMMPRTSLTIHFQMDRCGTTSRHLGHTTKLLGRCIRHRHDYGCLLLLDERFSSQTDAGNRNRPKVAGWIHKLYQTDSLLQPLPMLASTLQKFFKSAHSKVQNLREKEATARREKEALARRKEALVRSRSTRDLSANQVAEVMSTREAYAKKTGSGSFGVTISIIEQGIYLARKREEYERAGAFYVVTAVSADSDTNLRTLDGIIAINGRNVARSNDINGFIKVLRTCGQDVAFTIHRPTGQSNSQNLPGASNVRGNPRKKQKRKSRQKPQSAITSWLSQSSSTSSPARADEGNATQKQTQAGSQSQIATQPSPTATQPSPTATRPSPTAIQPQMDIISPSHAANSDQFCCPITCEPFVDPVIAADGQTYERKAIETWLARNDTSPLTNQPMSHKILVPNVFARQICAKVRAEEIVLSSAH